VKFKRKRPITSANGKRHDTRRCTAGDQLKNVDQGLMDAIGIGRGDAIAQHQPTPPGTKPFQFTERPSGNLELTSQVVANAVHLKQAPILLTLSSASNRKAA
jgi:hypothetical protein